MRFDTFSGWATDRSKRIESSIRKVSTQVRTLDAVANYFLPSEQSQHMMITDDVREL